MAWSTPSSRTTGDLITAAIWNADVVANPIALRAGAIALASQAAGDVIYASGASQFARLAIGTARQRLRVNSGATAPEWATPRSVSAFHGTTQSVASSDTALALNSEDYDTSTLHDTSSNNSRLTLPAGHWLLIGFTGATSSGGAIALSIRQDGTTTLPNSARTVADSGAQRLTIVCPVVLSGSAYFELMGLAVTGPENWGHASTRGSQTTFQAIEL